MGKSQLVDADIKEGERVIAAIAAASNVFAALWLYEADACRYYLVLALAEESPLAAYTKVQDALSHLSPPSSIGLDDIRIVKENDPLVRELRISLDLPSAHGMRLTNASVGSFYVDDAYIYRLESIPKVTSEQELMIAVKNGVWRAVPARFMFRVGLLQDIATTGYALPMTRGRRGLNVDVFVLQDVEDALCQPGSECKTRGKVFQLVFRDGRILQTSPVEENAEVVLRFDATGKLIA